ncbi:hypothetical protein [Microlunatus ginsengisoli]|uniref:Transposase n=1 Tax=Microlunatus ginsengisoli TaxID=363863 RepID=A0ABP7AYL8_9ACTN
MAEALVDVAEVMFTKDAGPQRDDRRSALQWVYSTRVRNPAEPGDLVNTLRWLRANTIQMTTFADRVRAAQLMRAALTRLSQKKSGQPAAVNTANRKRMVLHNVMQYGIESGVLAQTQ